jgi:hypothetical protein
MDWLREHGGAVRRDMLLYVRLRFTDPSDATVS